MHLIERRRRREKTLRSITRNWGHRNSTTKRKKRSWGGCKSSVLGGLERFHMGIRTTIGTSDLPVVVVVAAAVRHYRNAGCPHQQMPSSSSSSRRLSLQRLRAERRPCSPQWCRRRHAEDRAPVMDRRPCTVTVVRPP